MMAANDVPEAILGMLVARGDTWRRREALRQHDTGVPAILRSPWLGWLANQAGQ